MYKDKLLYRCEEIGTNCKQWALEALRRRDQLALRAIQGVVGLLKKFTATKINWACAQALKMGSVRYHTVKLMCADHTEEARESTKKAQRLLQYHEVIRDPQEYQNHLEKITEPPNT
jgi:hypothetical protein